MKLIDQEIIEQLRQGNDKAFETIYNHYQKVIYFMALTYFKNESTAEDIVQEVFIELHKHIDKITSPQLLTVWINKITYTKCMSILRKKNIQTVSVNPGDVERIEDKSVDSDILDVINRKYINNVIKDSLLKMDYDLKIVGLLRFYEELSIKDISDILDIPEGTVKSRIHTIKQNLKKELKDKGIYKPMSIIPLWPIDIKNNFHLLVDGNSNNQTPTIINKGTIAVVLGSIMIMISSLFIKDYIFKDKYINIEVETKYTNQSIPINIKTNQDYDYCLIDGQRNTVIEKNGNYQVSLIKNNKEVYKQTLNINNIDKNIPTLDKYEQRNKYIYIYLKDDLSGINPDLIQCINDNEKVDFTYNKEKQCLSFLIESHKKYIVHVNDYASNTLNININLGGNKE